MVYNKKPIKISNLRTAESVSPKHPDKLCDQISDAILDAHLKQDKHARVAVDVCGGHGKVFVTGEITSGASEVSCKAIIQRIVGKDIEVVENIATQSPEISQGVDIGGAGDQGIMIGYACNETPEFLPLEVVLSRRLNQRIFAKFPFDGKTQVTVNDEGKINGIVASFQNTKFENLLTVVNDWLKTEPQLLNNKKENKVLITLNPWQHGEKFVLCALNGEAMFRIYLNPAGDWSLGGFDADAGLTGRKLAVDNYGPRIPIGGGAFSGKDPSKVDRSAAYMARKIAVDYLQQRKAKEVTVRLAYAIGIAEPLEQTVIIDGKQEDIIGYDLTPKGIIESLNLLNTTYEDTAKYGHFGEGFMWG